MRNAYKILDGKLEGNRPLKDLSVGGKEDNVERVLKGRDEGVSTECN
jgi:hypothetical protein